MWLHELGHATVAWLSGFPAFPGAWFTPIAEERSLPFGLILAAALGFGVYRGAIDPERRWLSWVCGGLLIAQLFFSVVLRANTAKMAVIFGGDAGAMIYGTLAMATIFSPPGSRFHHGWLRWGFLVIGSAAFVNVFTEWWVARHSYELIMYGANEGQGPSDPSRLADDYGWTSKQLVNRYVGLGVSCLLALAGATAWATLRRRE